MAASGSERAVEAVVAPCTSASAIASSLLGSKAGVRIMPCGKDTRFWKGEVRSRGGTISFASDNTDDATLLARFRAAGDTNVVSDSSTSPAGVESCTLLPRLAGN